MKKQEKIVRDFYSEIWGKKNLSLVPTILNSDFVFRGSLGQEAKGHKGFIDYVEYIHGALSEYSCEIEDMVSESNKIFAKMKFTGIHTGSFIGFKPTNKEIYWSGAALFNFKDLKISNLWVLGDIKGLEAQF